jgi:ABC-2 type transport system ATP-binding protein
MEPVIELSEVVKAYGAKRVLDGVSLSLGRGTITGLLGKNGAGKSTLIKCALGLIRPASGRIAVLGEPAPELSDGAKARLGYVPQELKLYPWMKVRHLIEYTAAFYPRWNHRRVDRWVADWEIPLENRAGTLSGGETQKLGIILALGHEPELMIFDEPVASLDPSARREFLKALLEAVSDGERTILFSTHLTSDLERVADRVALLKDGRIAYHGGLDELKDSVKRLRLRAASPLNGALRVPGALAVKVSGREATATVRDFGPGVVESLKAGGMTSVEVEDLNLEDIFLEFHRDPVLS